MSDPTKLWTFIVGPIDGFCCEDAYASTLSTPDEILHSGGCPNRCSLPVPVPAQARNRKLPATYPCAYTRDHDRRCWLPPRYQDPADPPPAGRPHVYVAPHILATVPPHVLAAARRVVAGAAATGDVDAEMADPIADAVVAALVRHVRAWNKRVHGSCCAGTPGAIAACDHYADMAEQGA